MHLLESKKFIKAIWLLTIFLIIFVGEKVSFIFYPLLTFFKIFFIPVSFALIFYYIFVPVIDWLEKKKIKRIWGTTIFFVVVILIIVISLLFLGSSFINQFSKLIEYIPSMTDSLQQSFEKIKGHPLFSRFQDSDFVAVERLSEYFSKAVDVFFARVGSDASALLSFFSNTIVGIILLPVFLFYMLVEAKNLNKKVVSFIPEKYKVKGVKIFTEIDAGLHAFIKGRFIVSLFVGVISYIGYVFIGVEAPLVLATVSFFTNFIPYIGPILGAIPALIISLIVSFSMFIQVLILILVVQQVESLLISPLVMSKTLSIHPVVVIATVILGGHFAGILGVLFAVPFYLIIKVLVINLLPKEYGDKIES